MGWGAGALLGLGVAVAAVLLTDRRFFFVGDKQALFVPVMRDIGDRLLRGEFPVVDPDLAAAGNYALNPQFGLYDPFSLLISIALSRADNLVVAAALWSVSLLAVLCIGTYALLVRLRVPLAWAAAGALGVSLAGYTIYQLAPSWMAGMGSLVWVPWWWWCWYGPAGSRRSLLGLAVFAYLLVAGGWAPTWIAAATIGVGLLAEDVARRPRDRSPGEPRWWRAPLSRLLATLGGVVAGASVVVPLVAAYASTVRSSGIGDDGSYRPSFTDLLSVASPTHYLYYSVPGRGPNAPIFFVAWFVLVLAWGVAWSRAIRMRGVLAAAVATALGALATQVPFQLGPLRQGLRNLEGFQLSLVVLVLVAYATGSTRWTRGRVTGAVVTALATAYLAWVQDPLSARVLVGAALVTGCVAVLLVLFRWRQGSSAVLPAAFALVATVLLTGWAVRSYPYPAANNDHGMSADPPAVAPGVEAGLPTITIYSRPDQSGLDRLYRHGIGYGFTRLSDTYRPLNGASSIGQRYLNRRLCLGWYGAGCPRLADALQAVEPSTGRRWIDLLGVEQVQVGPGPSARAWKSVMGTGWQPVDREGRVTVYRRARPLPTVGRITDVHGPATVTAQEEGNEQQSYAVSAADAPTRLVFRDIYWPGYTATLAGSPLEVTPVAGVFVSVTIPAGATGTLTVGYAPAGENAMIALVVLGGVLVSAAAVIGPRSRPA